MPEHSSRLAAAMRDGLSKIKGRYPEIAKETGLNLYTIRKLASGDLDNPTARVTERVYPALVRRGLIQSTFDFSDCA